MPELLTIKIIKMTNIEYTNWLKRMIEGCDAIKGLEREKAIYQQCLKKARNLGQELPIHNVSNSLDLVELERKLDEVLDNETSESLKEWLHSKRL